MDFNYSIGGQSFHQKPTYDEYGKIKIESCTTSLKQLINCIEQGKCFTCQVYSLNKRNTNNFISQQLFALDFDGTLSLNQINEICEDYQLPYSFGYNTFSHTEQVPRYRIIFICKAEVSDSKLAQDIYKAFTIIFNEKNDVNCKDLARLWVGTNKKAFIHNEKAVFDPELVLQLANELRYSKAGNRARKEFEGNLIEKLGDNGKPILYRDNGNVIPSFNVETDKHQKLIDNWRLDDLLECQLFKRFYEGYGTPLLGCKLCDKELLCLASNLMTLEGGGKLYIECIEKNGAYKPEKKSKVSYLRNKGKYQPLLIGIYSPYDEDKSNQFQTFPELLNKKGRVEIDLDNQPQLYTLKEAEQKLAEGLEMADADSGNTVYLFKVAPGLGKSKHYINKKGIVIGFPSNNLKDEQYTSSELSYCEKLVTPDVLKKFTLPVQAYLRALYQKGLNENAFFKIKDLANGISIFPDGRIDYNDMAVAVDYLTQSKVVNDDMNNKSVFTTHTRLLHQQFKHYTYVFDENAFSTIFEHHKISSVELARIKQKLWLKGCAIDELELLLNAKENEMHSTPCFANYIEVVKELIRANEYDTNILKLFQSSRFIVNGTYIHYEVNHFDKLPCDKKLIFLDATASITLFKKIFGERLVVIDVTNVELNGSIQQYTSKSCSKSGLNKYYKKLSERVGTMPVITHNGYKKYFKNPVDTLHFGNLTGSNMLSGKDFCVVGTMTYHPSYYQFLAHRLDISCDYFKMKNLKVTYEGRRFWFTTFENPELQRLHLEQVEGELIQAVHRARLIRTNATVYLYSNFPLLKANYIY